MKLKHSTWMVVLSVALIALVFGAGVLVESNRLLAQSNQAQAKQANANQSQNNQTSQAALVRDYRLGVRE